MKKGLFVAACALLLSACFGGTTPPSQFYTLEPQMTTPVSETVAVSVGIDRIRLPYSLERPQMVTNETDAPDMTLSEFNRWIEPLPSLIQRTVITDLAQALPKSVVKDKSFSREKFTYAVQIDIVQLNTVLGSEAGLLAWVTIENAQGEPVTRLKVLEAVPVGKTYADMASAQSQLMNRLAQQIAQAIVAQKP